jgi:hypothetical protein
MTPPDEPGTPPPAGTPPPPYPTDPVTPGPTSPRPSTPVVAQPRRGSAFRTLVIGLVIGIILGGAGGYFLFNGNKSVTISNQPQASPSASPSATATPTATPVPPTVTAATPVAAPVGGVPCPVRTPTGQHPLGSPGGPGSGQSSSAGLDFCGGGNATIPTGTTRFLTGNNWGLGIADSCPVGSSGQAGMNTVLTVNEIIPGGGQGPDTATEPGDWVDSGSVLMASGGSYQLRVSTVSPSCVWHIKIYPTSG